MKLDHALAWLSALMLAGCLACDAGKSEVNLMLDPTGSDPGTDTSDPGDDPAPTSMAGTWDTTSVEVLDTCGFDPLPAEAALLIEETQNSAIFTFVDASGICELSVRDRTNDTVSLTMTDTVEACGGTVRIQSNMVYEFTGDGFTGTAVAHYTNVTGQCSNLPCEYRMAVAGQRCEGCWPGCNNATSAGPAVSPTSTVSGRADLAPRLAVAPGR